MTFFKHIKKIELAVLLIPHFEIDDHTSVEFWYLKKHIFLPLQHAFQWSRYTAYLYIDYSSKEHFKIKFFLLQYIIG